MNIDQGAIREVPKGARYNERLVLGKVPCNITTSEHGSHLSACETGVIRRTLLRHPGAHPTLEEINLLWWPTPIAWHGAALEPLQNASRVCGDILIRPEIKSPT